MKELFSMGLFWFFVLAEVFNYFMRRAFSSWRGANEVIPMIMTVVSFVCTIALVVLLVFVFIRVKPWWYGLVMVAAGFIISTIFPVGKTGELILGIIGIVAAPLFIVLSFLKVLAVL